ncbi:MAG: hypothetical protein ACWA5L_00835 [bacterium]
MILNTVLRWFGLALLAIAILLFGPILASYIASEGKALSGFTLTLLLCLFLGVGLQVITHIADNKGESRIGLRDVVLILVTWWTLIPIIVGLPFIFQGYGLFDSWFEAVSALTTTGGWLSQEGAREYLSTMIWRAELQWIGGLVSLSAAASLFIRPVFIGVDTGVLPFARGEQESFLTSFQQAFIVFTPFYVLFTSLIIVAFFLTGAPLSDSFVMGLSLIASGGFIPSLEGAHAYPFAVRGIIFVAMMLSGVNFIFLISFMRARDRIKHKWKDNETVLFIIICLCVSVIFIIGIQQFSLMAWGSQLFNAVSMLSTNGIFIGTYPPLVPVLLGCIIGGAAVSTAGGIKLLRWHITLQRAGEEIWKLIHPQAVLGRSKTVNELGIWIHYIGFTLSLAMLVLIITITGVTLELGVTAATAAVSNTGPLLAIAPGDVVNYNVFSPFAKIFIAIGMIMGRLEMVVTLALLNRVFWRA